MEALETLLELREKKETELKDIQTAIDKISESLYCEYVDRYFMIKDADCCTIFHIIKVSDAIAAVDIVYDNVEVGKFGFEKNECMAIKDIIQHDECSKFDYNNLLEIVSDKLIQQQLQ